MAKYKVTYETTIYVDFEVDMDDRKIADPNDLEAIEEKLNNTRFSLEDISCHIWGAECADLIDFDLDNYSCSVESLLEEDDE